MITTDWKLIMCIFVMLFVFRVYGGKKKMKYEGLGEGQRHFSTGAVRDNAEGKGRYDLLPMFAIHQLAIAMEKGAEKYGERNIDKGIPQHSLIDSGMRHLTQYIRGDKDEKHLVSALWNIAWAVQQDEIKPEMNDLPWTKEEWFE